VRLGIVLVVVGGALGVNVDSLADGDLSRAATCRVSTLSPHVVPGRSSFNFGNPRIAVALPPRTTFIAVPDGMPGGAFIQKDGWIRTKVGWFAAHGAPRVTGRRLDGKGGHVRADVGPLSFVSGGTFYPSLLYFPSLGCWRIDAVAGGAHLRAIVSVVRR
jgi:hypothetical protein